MANTDALPQLLTIDQLAERLGVSIRHIRRLIAERRVPYLKDGSSDSTRPKSPPGSTVLAIQNDRATIGGHRPFGAVTVVDPRGAIVWWPRSGSAPMGAEFSLRGGTAVALGGLAPRR